MALDIQLKRSLTPGSVPDAANVLVGEPVFNLADRILYTKDGNGNVITISSGYTSNIASLAFQAANVAASYTVAGVSGNVSNSQLAYGITSSGILTTANITELTNLYFTNARVRAAITVANSNVFGKGSLDSSTGILSISAANVTVSSSAPTNPNVGDMWINADSAKEYLFFSDGDSFQWVETGLAATSSASSSIVAGVQGDVSNVQLASGISQTGILTTANVAEVTNLYFTNARVYTNVTQLGYITNSSLSGYATNSQLTFYATTSNVVLKANIADLKTSNVGELTNLYFTNARAITAVTNASLSNITIGGQANITYQPASVIGTAITINAANTVGGTGYADVLKFTNSSGGASNPNKTIRLNSLGALEIIDSSYGNNIFNINDYGDLTVRGNVTVNGITGVTMPSRPAFRVYGANTTSLSATNTLTLSNFAVEYNQGSYLNASTGIFTAPVAGLYQVNLIARWSGSASIAAIQVQRTSGGTTTTQIYLEWAGNSTVYHMGGSTVVKMAAGDTLKTIVTSGTVTFDANDCWSVAYIG
jgi:hypothetical protein